MSGDPSGKPRSHWLKTGGLIGLAILIARFTRIPIASLIPLLPLLFPQEKRGEGQSTPPRKTGSMSKEEAQQILGVSAGASPDAIREAHRRLIQKNHPDMGGSDYLAAKVNQARDVLLN